MNKQFTRQTDAKCLLAQVVAKDFLWDGTVTTPLAKSAFIQAVRQESTEQEKGCP
jgi:hypothetical protein